MTTKTTEKKHPELVTISEASKRTGITRMALYQRIQRGKLPTITKPLSEYSSRLYVFVDMNEITTE